MMEGRVRWRSEREKTRMPEGEVTQGEGDKVKKKKRDAFRCFHAIKLKHFSSHM